MKKIFALTTALCLVVLACVPSISVRAFDTSNLFARTKNSVSGYWSDSVQDHIQQCVTSLNSNVNTIAAKVANLSTFGGAGNTFSKTYYAVFYWSDANYIMVYSFDDSGHPFIFCPDSIVSNTYAVSRYRICKTQASSMNAYAIGLSDNSFSEFAGAVSSENGVFVRDWANGPLLCTNLPVYVYNDTQTTSLSIIQASQETYTNYFPQDLPWINENGEIEYPAPSEAEVNTALAFDVFNSQVVYNQFNKTFTSANISWDLNPMGRVILETYPATEWDMKFTCQVTYNMSSYRPNNQTTPLQSYANGFTFTGTYAFEDYDSIMDGQIYGLDPIKGFETLSDAEIASAVNPDCNLFFALLGAMKGNYASGNSFTSGKSGFNLVGGTILRFIAGNYTSVGGLASAFAHLDGATGVNGRDWLEDHVSGDYVYMIDNFTMNVRAWFECGSIKSNYGDTDIDFLNHTTSSYAPRAYETEEGVTPTIPDPYTNTNDTPVEPGGLDANGVIVYVPVNVEVNVPSGGGSGDNTVNSGDNSIINNNNPTFNPVFNNNNENSVESLSDLIGEDAATANNGIGGFLDPFKNNAMVTLTGEYLGIIPDQLKTLLTAAVGILIILGIYRFIRRG